MKKIGIVGGVSWRSTIEYYRIICELSHRHQFDREPAGPPAIPEMAIESLNINKSFNMRGTPGDDASWARFDAYFNTALKKLEAGGAEVAFIASNTPHNRFDAITKGVSIPVISIFDAVARCCANLEIEEALILGTAPTMASASFANVLASHGINGFVPTNDTDKSAAVDLISEMQSGDVADKAAVISTIVHNCVSQFSKNTIAVCLSCTELPLAYPDHLDDATFEDNGVLYLNTTVIHATAVFEFASGLHV